MSEMTPYLRSRRGQDPREQLALMMMQQHARPVSTIGQGVSSLANMIAAGMAGRSMEARRVEDAKKSLGAMLAQLPEAERAKLSQFAESDDPNMIDLGQTLVASRMFKEPKSPVSVAAGGALVDPATGRVVMERPERPERPISLAAGGALVDPKTGQVIAERAEKAADQFGEPEYDEGTGKWFQINTRTGQRHYTAPQSGMDITVPDKDGNPITIRTGVGRGSKIDTAGMTPATTTKVEEKLLDMSDVKDQLDAINVKFKPEFQQIGPRWNALAAAWKEKGGLDVDPADKGALAEFAAHRAQSGKLMSQFTKTFGGTALTPQEAARIEVWAPKAGTGIFDGDSPTEYKTKLDAFTDFTNRTLAKYHYIRKRGLAVNAVDVDDMPSIIQKRGNELMLDASRRGLRGPEAMGEVEATLGMEFGLGKRGRR